MKQLKREIYICVGQTGMGKTVWTKEFLRSQKRVIIIDPQDEYDYLLWDNASGLFSYIQGRKIFKVKCTDLREFPDICFATISMENILLVVEEAQRILAPRLKIPKEFEDIIYRGRHSGTSLLLIAQRANTIDIAVRSQFSQLIVFRQTEKNDINWISDVTGFSEKEEIRNLEVFEYLHFTNIGMYRKKTKIFP